MDSRFHGNDSQASVAELAYAQGLGPCVLRDVEVRLLSLALIIITRTYTDGNTDLHRQ